MSIAFIMFNPKSIKKFGISFIVSFLFIFFSFGIFSIKVSASDTELLFNTFIGGSENDAGYVITHDTLGNVYVAGYKSGIGAYVTKLNSTGSLIWNTNLGCSFNNDIKGIFIDNDGYIYTSGTSGCSWGTPIRSFSGGNDAFVAKLNNSGVIQWNTFLGGSTADEEGTGIKISSGGNIFVTGTSRATWGSPIRSFGGGNYDPFLVKLNNAGILQWNTFLGGSGTDLGYDLVVDQDENVFITGNVNSTWGSPIRQFSGGTYDAFVVKVNNVGVLQWNTFLGGSNFDTGESIEIDSSGNLYVTGGTYLTTWGNPVRALGGNWDLSVFKLNNAGVLQWNTFLGGTGNESGKDIFIDLENNIYVIGNSDLNWGTPIVGFSGGIDGAISKLSSDGNLLWNMFFGGSGEEDPWGGTIDSLYNIYITGRGSASWGNPLRAYSGANNDTFVVKIKTTPLGNIVAAIPENIIPVLANNWNTDISSTGQIGVQSVDIINQSEKIIASFDVDFTNQLDWSGLTAEVSESKSLFHYPGGFPSLPGAPIESTYTLYIPKGDGDKAWICPGASSLEGISLNCSGGYYLSEGQTFNSATASVEEINGVVYWKVSGLTGTGGMSVVTGLKDTLSRLQVSSSSDHSITFGTNNGLTASGQFLVLAFDPTNKDFDLSSLTLSDIKLTDNVGNDRTLAALADINTWGVEIDSVLDTITFFSPTSGTGYYPAASQIVIKIGINAGGTHQIVNPSSTGSYQETIYILNTDMEGGSVQLPIIDSDRVDITGYVTAYMYFDIDTGTTDVNCNYNECLTHENGIQGNNYTVDLGELNSSIVNKSNTTEVMHSQGGMGIINSIYFDLSTNAPGGAVVSISSANGGLKGPGDNMLTSPGYDGFIIAANSGYYGYTVPATFPTATHGTIHLNGACSNPFVSCDFNQTKEVLFDTNGSPLENGRIRMDISAAAKYTNNPGLYTDTLTFVATATF